MDLAPMTAIDQGNGWITITIERVGRTRRFNLSYAEAELLIAKLIRLLPELTITRQAG